MVLYRTTFLLLAALLIPPTVFADFTGPVVSVLDGDTIEVLHNTHPECIRLSGMDWSRATLTLIGVSVAPAVTVPILFAFSNRMLKSII